MNRFQTLKRMLLVSSCALLFAMAVGCSQGASGSSSSAASASSDATPSAAASAESASAASDVASSDESQQSEAAASDAKQAEIDKYASQGYQLFDGVVHVVNAEELVKLQGVDIDPAAASGGGDYAVLVFDQPTDVSGMSADGSGERTETATMLGIAEFTEYDSFVVDYGDLDQWKPLDGQNVTVLAKAEDIMFPSDVRLPIGEPSANVVKLLGD